MAHLLDMSKQRRLVLSLALMSSALVGLASLGGCRPTSHVAAPAALGVSRPSSELEAVVDAPGPVTVETVVGADWEVSRAGLINLDDDEAKKAGLKDGPEKIVVLVHIVRHPSAGLFLVDTGVERALRDDPENAALSGFVAKYAGVDKIRVRKDTASLLAEQKERVKGVFLTHLHMDHVSGMRDVPNDALVYTGPGEASETGFLNLFVKPLTDAALGGKGDLYEWNFAPDPAGAFEGVIDVFGDRTFWAIWVPGHTAGSTAYLARTPDGPVLLTGDASHTVWGWEHGVEPGTFSTDRPRSKESLARLRRFVAKHPRIDVRLGHQIKGEGRDATCSGTFER
jgi:glyoxylase-like metal-dependent hydrolase (beta-lactamase superfamily II)